jgi:hypothetical protein
MMHRWFLGAVAGLLIGASAAAQTPAQSQPAAQIPEGEMVLGTVTIPRAVLADGKPLPAGRYTVRLTPEAARPAVPGAAEQLERWVEFVQGGQVRGRELASIVPAGAEGELMEGPDSRGRVGRNATRVEMLKGGEFLRIWIARNGNNYLIHLPPQQSNP